MLINLVYFKNEMNTHEFKCISMNNVYFYVLECMDNETQTKFYSSKPLLNCFIGVIENTYL